MSLTTTSLGPNGLTIQTLGDIVQELIQTLLQIYGPNIDQNPESPDMQMLWQYAQGLQQTLEFCQQIYNSRDPDQAVGVPLDLICSVNGVRRRPGTNTTLEIVITPNLAPYVTGTLNGSETPNPFTVQDVNGVQYQLAVATTIFTGTTPFGLLFQAVDTGPVTSPLNTIVEIVTFVDGVVAVNNPYANISIGVSQESDSQLRLRRAQSVAQPGKSWYQSLYANLVGVVGNEGAVVYENVTATTDSNGIPEHSIWTIIYDANLLPGMAGTPQQDNAANTYANIIFAAKGMGCGQKAHTTNGFAVTLTGPDGSPQIIQFDIPVLTQLYISINATSLPNGPAVAAGAIRQDIYNFFSLGGDGAYNVGQAADSSAILAYVKGLYPGINFSAEGVSLTSGSGYTNILIPTAQQVWNLGTNSAPGVCPNILINGT